MMKRKRTFINLFNHAFLRAAGLYLLGATAILTSCQKGETATDGMDLPETNTQYVLHPPIVNIEAFGGGSPVTRAALTMEEERQAFNVGEELGNIITLGNSEVEDIPPTRAFANGTYYRIVIYKLSEWNAGTLKIYEQRLCKTGSADYFADMGDSTKPVYLKKGDYRIFCYSFNKTTTEKMEKLADGTANVPLSDGDDFLSSDIINKSIDASHFDTSVALGTITLKHRCCRLIGTLTTQGFNKPDILASPAPSLSVTSTFTTDGNWSIKNTSFSVTTSGSSTKAFTLAKSGNNYTGTLLILPLTSKALATSYTFKPNGALKDVTASNKSISGNVTFNSSGSYSFTIKSIGAYVITEGVESLKIGNYTWAIRNVRWNNTFETNLNFWESGNLRGAAQATTSNAAQNSDYNSYFLWGSKSAFVDGGSYETGSTWQSSNNPCPSGYRVPGTAEFNNLITKKIPKNMKVYINGETHTISNNYSFYDGNKAKGLVLKDGDNILFLPAAGTRYGTGWGYGTVGSLGYYWCNKNYNQYAYCLYFSNAVCELYATTSRDYGLSVRCVK